MKREASLRRVHEKGFKERVRIGGRRMGTKEEREGLIPLPNPPHPPPPPSPLPPTTSSLVLSRYDHYVGSKENNGAESDTLILALGICEFH